MKYSAWAFVLLVAVITAGCSHDSNIKPPHELVTFTPTVDVQRLWTASVGDGANESGVRMQPAFEDGTIYVASVDGYLKAIDMKSGDTIWRKTRPWRVEQDIGYAGGPTVHQGVLAIGTVDGHIYTYEAKTGKPLWQTSVNSSILSSPVFTKSLILVRGDNGNITALNRADGSTAWVYDEALVPALSLRGAGNIIVRDGIAYFGTGGGQLVAISLDDGNALWSRPLSSGSGRTAIQQLSDVDGQIVLDDGVLYASAYHGHLAAIDTREGQLLWSHPFSSYVGVVLQGSTLVGIDDASNVWAWDAGSGGNIWKQDGLQWRWLGPPAVQESYAVVGDFQGYLHWLNLSDGSFAARVHASDSAIRAQPLVLSDGRVVVEDVEGRISAWKITPR